MAAAPATSVVVELRRWLARDPDYRDLRTRVVAAGLSGDQPVSAAMSAPAYTCGPNAPAGRCCSRCSIAASATPRRLATGRILGVVEDTDIVAAQARSSFFLRQAIARRRDSTSSSAPLERSADGDRDARRRARRGQYLCRVRRRRRRVDTSTARARHGGGRRPGSDFAWLALGSQARREAMPSSDVIARSSGSATRAKTRSDRTYTASPPRVVAGLDGVRTTAGLSRRDAGRPAVHPLARFLAAGGPQLDRRPYPGPGADPGLGARRQPARMGDPQGHARADTFRRRRATGAAALAGSLRALAPATDRLPAGARRRALRRASRAADLKHGGRDPDVDLARWAGIAAG